MRPGVLQVVLSLSPGGTERLVIELAKRLRSRFRMAVCCLDEAGAWAGELSAVGVPVFACGRRPGFHPVIGAQIATIAAETGAGILHCHHYSPFVYGALAALRSRATVLFTEHGRLSDAPPSFKRRLANRLLAPVPRQVFAVSRDLAAHVRAEGFGARSVEVVYNGIDPGPEPDEARRARARAALGLGANAVVVATVARLDPVKDLPTLLEAFRRFAATRPDAHLVIIGDGPERTKLEHLSVDLGTAERVYFTGARADARALLPAADLYVNSSITEGVSLTILEAMAAGLPVVATAVGGTPEVVVHDRTGVLVPPRNPAALAAALRTLAASPARRAALTQAARAEVELRFSLDAMVARYAAVYDAVGEA